MNNKYMNKYRRTSARLQKWDYGWNAFYFVTICTKDRVHFFGEIAYGEMQLSKIGEIAYRFWMEIPEHFPFVKLDAFVVMPNHIHGIIIIDKPDDGQGGDGLWRNGWVRGFGSPIAATGSPIAATGCTIAAAGSPIAAAGSPIAAAGCTIAAAGCTHPAEAPKLGASPTAAASKKWTPASLGVIINQYKRICTIHSRKINPHFEWQSRYYDHVIRNAISYVKIKSYIIKNPMKWGNNQIRL